MQSWMATAGTLLLCGSSAALAEDLAPDVRTALHGADRVELLSLEPTKDSSQSAFHGWKVLGSTVVTDPSTLAAALDKGMAEAYAIAGCWSPRHGIRINRGSSVMDLVICFHCQQIAAYVDGEAVAGAATTKSPQRVLDAILKKAGVRLARSH